jgi:hypothetical protein
MGDGDNMTGPDGSDIIYEGGAPQRVSRRGSRYAAGARPRLAANAVSGASIKRTGKVDASEDEPADASGRPRVGCETVRICPELTR